jgi:pimeloyl-ACP methyl ester carboxylesterase
MAVETRPRRGGRRSPLPDGTAAGLLVAVLGLLATATGAGLGIRHLQKAGLSPTAVLGLGLMVVGVALLALAVAAFWRSVHGWRRLWLVPAGLVALPVTYAVVLAVSLTVVPPTEHPAGRTPAAYGLVAEEVEFTTADGVPLSAWWARGTNGAAVVLRHGAGETRAATLPQAQVLARSGYGVLLVDARGHGSSGGRGMELGWYGDLDVSAAVDFVAEQDGVDEDRIALLGLSMGGEEALGAAATDRRIRAVVAEGATGRTAEDKDGWLPGGLTGVVQRRLDLLTYGLVDVLTPASPPQPLVQAVAEAEDTPVLLITAGSVPDEARAAAVLRDRSPDRVEVWTVPDAAHTHALAAAPEEWAERVTTFLDGALA